MFFNDCHFAFVLKPDVAEEADSGALADLDTSDLEGATGYTPKSVYQLVCGEVNMGGVRRHKSFLGIRAVML